MICITACAVLLGIVQEEATPKDFRFSVTLRKRVGPSRGGEWDCIRVSFDGKELQLQDKGG